MFPKEMDAFIDDEDVGYLDALLDVPDLTSTLFLPLMSKLSRRCSVIPD